MSKIDDFMNAQDLGRLEEGYANGNAMPVAGTPGAVVAAVGGKKVVGAVAAGAGGVAAAYTVGRVVN